MHAPWHMLHVEHPDSGKVACHVACPRKTTQQLMTDLPVSRISLTPPCRADLRGQQHLRCRPAHRPAGRVRDLPLSVHLRVRQWGRRVHAAHRWRPVCAAGRAQVGRLSGCIRASILMSHHSQAMFLCMPLAAQQLHPMPASAPSVHHGRRSGCSLHTGHPLQVLCSDGHLPGSVTAQSRATTC